MVYVIAILAALAAYLLGSISGAIIISGRLLGEDIRTQGSKNAGSTNMLRVYGKKYALFTLLIDLLKGVIAVLIGIFLDRILENTAMQMSVFEKNYIVGSMKYIMAVFAVLGHDFPLYFGFKGGKGVATSIAAALTLDWKIGLIVAAAALIIMAATRYVSLGSVAGAVIYPCIVGAFMIGNGEFVPGYLICALILGFLIVIKHRANIKRLKNGTENKLFAKKKEEADLPETENALSGIIQNFPEGSVQSDINQDTEE